MKRPNDPANLGNLNYSDLTTFLAIVANTEKLRPDERRSFSNLTRDVGKFSTVYTQTKRIAEFFLGDISEPYKKFGVELLFAEQDEEIGLRPTPLGRLIAGRFELLVDAYEGTRSDILAALKPNKPRVKIGCAHAFFYRLLAPVFARYRDLLGKDVELILETAPSEELARRLHVGLHDFIVVFGPPDKQDVAQGGSEVILRSLGYKSRMVLLCPPTGKVLTKPDSMAREEYGPDANDGYWKVYREQAREGRVQGFIPYGKKMRGIKLEDIDFGQSDSLPLIHVPSWNEPVKLRDLVGVLHRRRMAQDVAFYDDAYSRARMGALAVASEVYCLQPGVTAFRLLPEEDFTRWISVGENSVLRIPSVEGDQARRFLRAYLAKFKADLRKGKAPSLGDARYDTLCDRLAAKFAKERVRRISETRARVGDMVMRPQENVEE